MLAEKSMPLSNIVELKYLICWPNAVGISPQGQLGFVCINYKPDCHIRTILISGYDNLFGIDCMYTVYYTVCVYVCMYIHYSMKITLILIHRAMNSTQDAFGSWGVAAVLRGPPGK